MGLLKKGRSLKRPYLKEPLHDLKTIQKQDGYYDQEGMCDGEEEEMMLIGPIW